MNGWVNVTVQMHIYLIEESIHLKIILLSYPTGFRGKNIRFTVCTDKYILYGLVIDL